MLQKSFLTFTFPWIQCSLIHEINRPRIDCYYLVLSYKSVLPDWYLVLFFVCINRCSVNDTLKTVIKNFWINLLSNSSELLKVFITMLLKVSFVMIHYCHNIYFQRCYCHDHWVYINIIIYFNLLYYVCMHD